MICKFHSNSEIAFIDIINIYESKTKLEVIMDQYELKKEISTSKNYILSRIFSLFQRSLQQECASFIKQIESDAKKMKKGKVILVAILKED